MKLSHLLLIGLLLSAVSAGCRPEEPPPFPQLGALKYVEKLCEIGPRVSCTPGAEAAAKWIAEELGFMGYSAVIDTFNDPDENGKKRLFRNVIATLQGEGGKCYLLLSHYDTKDGISPDFIGANDSGSSTGLLLALASYFKQNGAPASLIFAFVDGEESKVSYTRNDGLHGSRRLAGIMRSTNRALDGVIVMDMVGDKNLKLTIPGNTSPKLLKMLKKSAKKLKMQDIIEETTVEILDDHEPFLLLGYPAIDLIDFDYGPQPNSNSYWHTPEDTPDKLSDDTLNKVGALVIDMISL